MHKLSVTLSVKPAEQNNNLDSIDDLNTMPAADKRPYFSPASIAISLIVENRNWKGLATDIDLNVIGIAQKNHKKISLNSNLNFYCGNWWEPLKHYAGKINLAISNPPYIPKKIYERLPSSVKDFEPKKALYGGEDGLYHIKQIVSDAPKFLKKGGWLILENHFDQTKKIKNLLRAYGFDSLKTINDTYGIGRFTIGRYK